MTVPAILIALPSKVMTFHYVLMTLHSTGVYAVDEAPVALSSS